ncbi:hypothetical protein GHT06_016822 [Daphnia sinensis]|uniref:Uncharacterized protein n=1 Tax=Daphnia sinensis TaxID=1820382 RepID=A0AAD5PRC8_9CRUS|nr:hypothetical protein GHT06_016822 [Daphnia sinensis]
MDFYFEERPVLICFMVDYANTGAKERALLNRIEIATSEEERFLLEELSSHNQYVVTLLLIRTMGVQYSYCVALSSVQTQPNWNDIATHGRFVILRPFLSQHFKTGLPAIPYTHLFHKVVHTMGEAVLIAPGISRIMYDVTVKPVELAKWSGNDLICEHCLGK